MISIQRLVNIFENILVKFRIYFTIAWPPGENKKKVENKVYFGAKLRCLLDVDIYYGSNQVQKNIMIHEPPIVC